MTIATAKSYDELATPNFDNILTAATDFDETRYLGSIST